jgi:ABC-type uncharacterized transport system substrate-binding protein
MDKNVGWLSPAASITSDMQNFQTRLQQDYTGGTVNFPDPQFLNGDNSKLDDAAQTLLNHNPPFDVIVVAGSSGTRAVARAQAARANKIPIVQVIGGDPVPENSTLVTGYHIDAAKVAAKQVKKLYDKHSVNRITVLVDYTSDTSARVFNAIQGEATKHGIALKPLFARNPAELQALSQLSPNPVDTSFMLAPSGMFFNSNNIGYIISLVEGANVPAIYPEREYKIKHSAGYKPRVMVHGHHISNAYLAAADLVNDIFAMTSGSVLPQGGEADQDDY